MKKITLVFGSIIIITIFIASCQKETFISDEKPNLSAKQNRKIVVENFIGHLSTYSGGLSQGADSLMNKVENIIIINIHAGNSAIQNGNTYFSDYRTSVGNELFEKFNRGWYPDRLTLINRIEKSALMTQGRIIFGADTINYGTNTINNSVSQGFLGFLKNRIQKYPGSVNSTNVFVKISNVYSSTKRSFSTTINTEFLTLSEGTYNLSVYILEDSIKDWQLMNGKDIPNFPMNHVLRDALNKTWGDTIAKGTTVSGTRIEKSYTYTIPFSYQKTPCDPKNCSIVAFVYNADTYEIIQAEEEIIIKP